MSPLLVSAHRVGWLRRRWSGVSEGRRRFHGYRWALSPAYQHELAAMCRSEGRG